MVMGRGRSDHGRVGRGRSGRAVVGALALTAGLVSGLPVGPTSAAVAAPIAPTSGTSTGAGDVVVTTVGTAEGLHLLVGRSDDGYEPRQLATLAVEGIDAPAWTGTSCVTGDGRFAAVSFSPVSFVNDPVLVTRGGFAAVVDLGTGHATVLAERVSLRYHSPGCGRGNEAVFSRSTGEADVAPGTELIRVDAASATVVSTTAVDHQGPAHGIDVKCR